MVVLRKTHIVLHSLVEEDMTLGRKPAQWQGGLLRTWGCIRWCARHAVEGHLIVHGELLDEADRAEELVPVIKLELDEPAPIALPPVVVLLEHALDVVRYAAQQPDQVGHLLLDLGYRRVVVLGGRLGPDVAEFFVLAPVASLTGLVAISCRLAIGTLERRLVARVTVSLTGRIRTCYERSLDSWWWP